MADHESEKKRVYKPLPTIESREQALGILEQGEVDELMRLPLAVGLQCSKSDKEFAQELCLKLADNDCSAVRANAILGLAYIAIKHKWLDKRIVKPYIIRELRTNDGFNWRIVDAVEDINDSLGWQLAKKPIQRIKNQRRDSN